MSIFPERKGIMLAKPVTQKKVNNFGEVIFSQPKLNGERMRVEWFHDMPILLSSYGNEFKFLDHIKEALINNFKYNQLCLDGEVYVHGWKREKIHSAVARKVNRNTETTQLQFHIFDYQSTTPQWRRIQILEELKKNLKFENPLFLVPYNIVKPENWLQQAEIYTQNEYEGIILRHPAASYEAKRSSYLLKFKPTEEDEYEIISITEAISQRGYNKNMVGSFLVQGDDGVTFSVGAGKLTHIKRIDYWRNREDLIGRTLKVKHELLKTRNKIPLCAVAVDLTD